MNFLQKLLQGIAFVPTIVNSVEGLFGSHTGEQKKESAITFVAAALQLTEAVAIAKLWTRLSSSQDLEKSSMARSSA